MCKVVGVQLGRFAPYHRGHENITRGILSIHGMDNMLMLIGSSNVVNEATPFTFEQRKEMVRLVFPDLQILPLPDINPYRQRKDDFDTTFAQWLQTIHALAEEQQCAFTFYGGSEKDLFYLSKIFETRTIVDRKHDGISASLIRQLLREKKHKALEKYLHPEVARKAIAYFHH